MPPSEKVNNLPASIHDLFMGRDGFLAGLTQRLEENPNSVLVIHGLGGIGKTRVAIEFGYRYADRFSALLFIDADSRERLRQGLARLAGPMVLDLPEQNLPPEMEDGRISGVLKWIRQNPGWYLVLDNVDDAEAAQAVREEVLAHIQGRGTILITARHGVWESPQAEQLELGVLDEEAGTAYLEARTAEARRRAATDEEDARQIVKELSGLALAIEQAAAYVARQRISFADYLEDWKEAREEVLNWEDRERTQDYKRPGPNDSHAIAVTWQATIKRLDPDALSLLHILAWFAPEPIPQRLLEADGLGPRRRMREASGELLDYALITQDRDSATIQMHSLVQESVRLQTPEAEVVEYIEKALQMLEAQELGEPENVESWPSFDPLRSHLEMILARADSVGLAQESNELRSKLARFLYARGQFAKAEPWLRRSLEIDEVRLGMNDPALAPGLTDLALLLYELNRLGEAESLLRRAINLTQPLGNQGPLAGTYTTALNNLALVLQDTNRVGEAERVLREAIALDEQRLGDSHPDVAGALNNLALLLQATSRYNEAEPLMRRALQIDELAYGPDHPEVARDLNNYGLLLHTVGRTEDAEKVVRQALEIDTHFHGSAHPDVGRDLSMLAMVLADKGETEEARLKIVHALEIHEQCLGRDHPRVAADLVILGRIHMLEGDMDSAKMLLERGLEIDQASYGNEHPAVARDLNNLAHWYHVNGQPEQARESMQRANNIYDRLYTMTGFVHPEREKAQQNLDQIAGGTPSALPLSEPQAPPVEETVETPVAAPQEPVPAEMPENVPLELESPEPVFQDSAPVEPELPEQPAAQPLGFQESPVVSEPDPVSEKMEEPESAPEPSEPDPSIVEEKPVLPNEEAAPEGEDKLVLRRFGPNQQKAAEPAPKTESPKTETSSEKPKAEPVEKEGGLGWLGSLVGLVAGFLALGLVLFISLFFPALGVVLGVIITGAVVLAAIFSRGSTDKDLDYRELLLRKVRDVGRQNLDGLLLRADGSIEVIPPLAARFGNDPIYVLHNPDPKNAALLEPLYVAIHSGASFRVQMGGKDFRIEAKKVSSHEVLLYLDNQMHRVDLNNPQSSSPLRVEILGLS